MAPRLLILSFSSIAGDARVLKQVRLFAERYEVTTCGFGPAPEGVAEHLELAPESAGLMPDGRTVTLRQYRRAYGSIPAVAAARVALAGQRFDVVLANDVEAVGVGLEVGAPVHADLHEYSPRLHEENRLWMLLIAPFFRWMCRRHVSRAVSVTTVGEGLAREYEREFGFRAGVVTNATPYAELEPGAVGRPLRLVHSGAGLRNRDLKLMLDAVDRCAADVTLDLLITPNHPAYIDELRERAAQIPGVRVLDPVPYAELIATLNGYDVGVFVLPPSTFSYANALPNKLFDYVQARLGIVVGPSWETAGYVERYGLGLVTQDFTSQGLARTLDELTPERVARWKVASHAAAEELSAGEQVLGWARAVEALMPLSPDEVAAGTCRRCGHEARNHPGPTSEWNRCLVCVEDEDHDRIATHEMCARRRVG